jgi:cytochrome oxidase assembly protein ShyY1
MALGFWQVQPDGLEGGHAGRIEAMIAAAPVALPAAPTEAPTNTAPSP